MISDIVSVRDLKVRIPCIQLLIINLKKYQANILLENSFIYILSQFLILMLKIAKKFNHFEEEIFYDISFTIWQSEDTQAVNNFTSAHVS